MARGRVEAVVGQQGVLRRGGEADAVAQEDGLVELDVVADEGFRRIREERTEEVDEDAVHVPRPARGDGEGKADELAEMRLGRVMPVIGGRLGVEGDARLLHEFVQKRAGLVLGGHESVGVGDIREGFEGRVGLDGEHGRVRRREDFAGKARELVFGADVREFIAVEAVAPARVPVRGQGDIRADGRQELGDLRVLAPILDAFGELAFQFRGVGEDAFHGAEAREEVRRRLLADALDAGDVVGRVAGEREVVDHLGGGSEAPMFADPLLVVDFRRVARVGGTVEADVGGDELGGVLVWGGEVDREAFRRAEARQGAHHVVRLEAFRAQDGDVQGVRQLERVGDVGREVLGHFLPRGLVGGIGLLAEGRAGRVHRQDEVVGLFAAQDAQEAVRETQERGGVETGRGQARIAQEHEVALVEKGHQIDNEQFLHTRLLLGRLSVPRAGPGPAGRAGSPPNG